jgi:hypothetical protein
MMMMLHAAVRGYDARGHHPECSKHGKDEPPTADETTGHVDLFCDCHRFERPMILKNGTDIAWPAGWTEREAEEWRQKNNLAHGSEPGAGP